MESLLANAVLATVITAIEANVVEKGELTDPFKYPNGTRRGPPISYKDGPMPTISDSLFSLIILIYVGVIFVFMFFAFCWKEPEPPPPDPAHKNIPMITSMLDEMEKAEAAKAEEEASLAAEAAAAAAKNSSEMLAGESTEMKDMSSNDKVNVISEKTESNNVGNNEAATSVWESDSLISRGVACQLFRPHPFLIWKHLH